MKKYTEIVIEIRFFENIACIQQSSVNGFDGEYDFFEESAN